MTQRGRGDGGVPLDLALPDRLCGPLVRARQAAVRGGEVGRRQGDFYVNSNPAESGGLADTKHRGIRPNRGQKRGLDGEKSGFSGAKRVNFPFWSPAP